MEAPDHAWISALPAGAQFAINAAIGLATLIGGLWAYLSQARKSKPTPVAPATHDAIAVPMLQIADMSPVRELVTHVRRLADAQERVAVAHDKLLDLAHGWVDDDRERYIRGLERLAEATRRG